jgi:hypothetical protein
MIMSKTALETYEEKQQEIEQLLKQIKAGLELHDHKASKSRDGHNWAHVGDLNRITAELQDISDRLHDKGEYARKS